MATKNVTISILYQLPTTHNNLRSISSYEAPKPQKYHEIISSRFFIKI